MTPNLPSSGVFRRASHASSRRSCQTLGTADMLPGSNGRSAKQVPTSSHEEYTERLQA